MKNYAISLPVLISLIFCLFSCELNENLVGINTETINDQTLTEGANPLPSGNGVLINLPYTITTTHYDKVVKLRITWAYPIEDAWYEGLDAFKSYPTRFSFDNATLYGQPLNLPANVDWHLNFNLAFHGFSSNLISVSEGHYIYFKVAEGFSNNTLDKLAFSVPEAFQAMYEKDPDEAVGDYSLGPINPSGYNEDDTYTFIFNEPGGLPRYGAIKYMGMNPITGGKIMEMYLQKPKMLVLVPPVFEMSKN
ncbi:hypothetical protein [Flexithrix dorotheae]|uniref:hypothetical protein n=1 Tax=Flexithrix dorotheae TaxID=70993 RepID=UPI00035E2559|nr:hypothetical protein [Flexithrix dorotheae]